MFSIGFPCTKFNKRGSCGPCLGFHIGDAFCDFFDPNDDVHFLAKSADLFDILVLCKVFESKGQAKKNWQGCKAKNGWDGLPKENKIPPGWSEVLLKCGGIVPGLKAIFIWNPL